MKQSLTVVLVLGLLLGAWSLVQPRAAAAPLDPPQAPQAVAISVFPASIPADTTDGNCATGTPYAIYVSATGLDAGLSYTIKGYHYRTADTNNKGCFWNWQTASWVAIDNTYTGLPVISGVTEWSGWLYLKDIVGHAGTADMKLRVRVRSSTAVNSDATVTPAPMDMSTAGGWLSGHAYAVGGAALSGAPVIVRNGSAIVGIYATEDNAVSEGNTSADTGFFKVAAPVGSGLTAEVWSGGTLTGTATTGLSVQANAVTPNVVINELDVTPPTVQSTVPTANATGVSPYQPLSATFSEALDPATVTDATFTLAGPGGAVAGTVTYADATHTAAFAPTAVLGSNTTFTATLSTGIKDTTGNPLAVPYVWSFSTGAADTVSPTIAAHSPATNAISVPLNSTIVITFSESLKPSTVTQGNFALVGPQGSVGWTTFTYDAGSFKVTAAPVVLLPTTRYTITVDGVTDWAGNGLSGVKTWSFTTNSEAVLQAYHGDLHNHTSYSDGSLTAATAYATGKANGFDFMAVTDHSYAVDDGEWADMLAAAEAATIDGEFVALRGVEYTQGAEGHINVINTVRHPVRTNTGCAFCDYTPNLEKGVTVDGFYNWLSITGTVGLNGEATIAQFNHPGWINFNDWTYHPEVSPTMKLEEVGNGSGTSYVFSEDEYIRSLDYGWKLGATNNADTHSPYWGANTEHRTGAWLSALTKTDLLDALEARRTFATEDKNYELKFKGNGAWQGSEIPNTGSIVFEVGGFDPEAEGNVQVQLISFGGEVITQTTTTSTFVWQPIVPVAPGVHYFYVKVTQADGDRIVSSPIWTQSAINVALTDLAVEPTIATIYNPSLITARVSNRAPQTQTVTVTFSINNVDQASLATAVPPCVTGPCVDGFANITWQPSITGPVTITARLSGTPVGDNPDDDTRTITMNATDQKVPLVLIDAGHGNIASTPRDVRTFVNDLTAHGYNVLLNLDTITASDLNTETVKLLIVNAYGPDQMTVTETQAIANFVNAGGSLWLNGLADYTGKVTWAGTTSNRFNELLTSIEATTGYTVPVRVNSDEVLDGNNNNGYPWGVLFHIFPNAANGFGTNVENIQTWSGCSFVDRNYTALTQDDLGANGFIAALGDLDAGSGTYGEANATHNEDSNVNAASPFFAYNGTVPLPGAAAYDIPGAAGRLYFYGDANDPFNIFSYTAGDGRQNELFNLQTVMWLLGQPVAKTTIAEARAYTTVNQPEKLDQLVWIEGKITAALGEFFNVMYVEDETGGLTIHAPAGDIDPAQYKRGAYVRVLGTVGIYQGDTEVEFFEAEQVQVITPTNNIDPLPLPFSTHDAALEANQGWLTQITGTVTLRDGESIYVDDGSGPVRAFLDGYNGVWDSVNLFDRITVKGLISEDGGGPRIRVRNYNMHVDIPNDVTILAAGKRLFLPLIRK